MCQFNLLVIDKEFNKDELRKIVTESGFGYRIINFGRLPNEIGEGRRIILTTKDHCDCGSILGINKQGSLSKINIEKEKQKLRKKKWSESKIDRHLQNKLKKESKRMGESELGNEMEENNWIRLAETLLKEKVVFGILFHHFEGLIEEEEIEIEKVNEIPIVSLKSGGRLRDLKEDELNWIRN